MVAYHTGLNPIEIGDIGLKVKVTVAKNVSQNDEKYRQNFKYRHFFIKTHHFTDHFITVILIPNMTLLCNE